MSTITTPAADLIRAWRVGLDDTFDAWRQATQQWEESNRWWPSPDGSGKGRSPTCCDDSDTSHCCDSGTTDGCCGTGESTCCDSGTSHCCDSGCHPDVDLILNTRLGERRVLPFRVRNTWRRERQVTLAVGAWQHCRGDQNLRVQGAFDVGDTLTLAPCSTTTVRLLVGTTTGGKDRSDSADDLGDLRARGKDGQLPDLGCCSTWYTDLRFEGCARPQRLAVVVHSTACAAIDLRCGCDGCC